jgi:hypothetical protein
VGCVTLCGAYMQAHPYNCPFELVFPSNHPPVNAHVQSTAKLSAVLPCGDGRRPCTSHQREPRDNSSTHVRHQMRCEGVICVHYSLCIHADRSLHLPICIGVPLNSPASSLASTSVKAHRSTALRRWQTPLRVLPAGAPRTPPARHSTARLPRLTQRPVLRGAALRMQLFASAARS